MPGASVWGLQMTSASLGRPRWRTSQQQVGKTEEIEMEGRVITGHRGRVEVDAAVPLDARAEGGAQGTKGCATADVERVKTGARCAVSGVESDDPGGDGQAHVGVERDLGVRSKRVLQIRTGLVKGRWIR